MSEGHVIHVMLLTRYEIRNEWKLTVCTIRTLKDVRQGSGAHKAQKIYRYQPILDTYRYELSGCVRRDLRRLSLTASFCFSRSSFALRKASSLAASLLLSWIMLWSRSSCESISMLVLICRSRSCTSTRRHVNTSTSFPNKTSSTTYTYTQVHTFSTCAMLASCRFDA